MSSEETAILLLLISRTEQAAVTPRVGKDSRRTITSTTVGNAPLSNADHVVPEDGTQDPGCTALRGLKRNAGWPTRQDHDTDSGGINTGGIYRKHDANRTQVSYAPLVSRDVAHYHSSVPTTINEGVYSVGLGLKDYKADRERGFVANLSNLRYEIKYACQRFWRGYDDIYLFGLDSRLDELIPEILLWLRNYRVGSPVLNSAETCHEDWNKVLDEILFHFKEADEEKTSQRNMLNSKEESKEWFMRESEIEKYRAHHRKQAYLMVAKYMGYFWD